MSLTEVNTKPIANTTPCPDHHGCWVTWNNESSQNLHSIQLANAVDKTDLPPVKIQQPMVAIIDKELAMLATGTNIIVREDRFKTGYECKVCEGSCISKSVCPRCKGSKVVPSSSLDDKSEGLTMCKACRVMSDTGSMIAKGFIPCATCAGKGGSVIVPQESMRRPSSGVIVSTGNGVLERKCGERVLYSNHAGHAMNFKQKTVFRIMHEHEVLSLLMGLGDIGDKLD